MKKIILGLCLGLLLVSCSKNSDSPSATPTPEAGEETINVQLSAGLTLDLGSDLNEGRNNVSTYRINKYLLVENDLGSDVQFSSSWAGDSLINPGSSAGLIIRPLSCRPGATLKAGSSCSLILSVLPGQADKDGAGGFGFNLNLDDSLSAIVTIFGDVDEANFGTVLGELSTKSVILDVDQ